MDLWTLPATLYGSPVHAVSNHCRKLISTHPCDHVRGPNAFRKTLSYGNEHFVTDFMPILIVDCLEAIQIEKQQGKRFLSRLHS